VTRSTKVLHLIGEPVAVASHTNVLLFKLQVTRSTKVLHLIRRLIEVGIYTPPRQQQQQQHMVNPQQPGDHRSSTSYIKAPAAAASGAVVAPGAGSAAASTAVFNSSSNSHAAQPMKAIVFSQFWMHVQLIAAELTARGVRHVLLKGDMPARDKQAAVTSFRAARVPCCMVMDESGGQKTYVQFHISNIKLLMPVAYQSFWQSCRCIRVVADGMRGQGTGRRR
jgi:superfamily II DNA/RNA helicase